MKKEDVEKAAHEYSERYSADAYYSGAIGSFIAGAEWRINSIWHDASEKPKDNAMILIIDRFGFPFF